jgi:hypothetical protein
MRVLLVTLVLGFAGTLAVDLEPAAAPTPDKVVKTEAEPATVEVAFVRRGRLVRVERVVPKGVSPEMHALRELVQGPTRLEQAKGIRTALRPGVRLRSLRAVGDLWLASFSRSLFGPGSPQTKRTRLTQVAVTLARLGRKSYAAISTEGRLVTTIRLGMRLGAWRPERGEKGYLYDVRGIQLRLHLLGFLDRSAVTGVLDYTSEQALLAFQGWEDLVRTGTVTGETQVELVRATPPRPFTHRVGRRIEIHRDLGVLLMIENNDVLRAVHTSTGASGATPDGAFRVYRKELLSWSVPFRVWMPYAAYFIGGIATHEYSHVPEYPASHGCVRLPAGEAERVYRFVDVGTPVHVF